MRASQIFCRNIALPAFKPINTAAGVSAKAAAVLASVLQPAKRRDFLNAREPWERWRAASARISTKTPDRKTKLPTQSSPTNTAGASRCTSRCSFSGKNAMAFGPVRRGAPRGVGGPGARPVALDPGGAEEVGCLFCVSISRRVRGGRDERLSHPSMSGLWIMRANSAAPLRESCPRL